MQECIRKCVNQWLLKSTVFSTENFLNYLVKSVMEILETVIIKINTTPRRQYSDLDEYDNVEGETDQEEGNVGVSK